MSYGMVNYLMNEVYRQEKLREELKEKIKDFIIENCVSSDEWTELENHKMIPTGNIKYKSLSSKKVEELMYILRR